MATDLKSITKNKIRNSLNEIVYLYRELNNINLIYTKNYLYCYKIFEKGRKENDSNIIKKIIKKINHFINVTTIKHEKKQNQMFDKMAESFIKRNKYIAKFKQMMPTELKQDVLLVFIFAKSEYAKVIKQFSQRQYEYADKIKMIQAKTDASIKSNGDTKLDYNKLWIPNINQRLKQVSKVTDFMRFDEKDMVFQNDQRIFNLKSISQFLDQFKKKKFNNNNFFNKKRIYSRRSRSNSILSQNNIKKLEENQMKEKLRRKSQIIEPSDFKPNDFGQYFMRFKSELVNNLKNEIIKKLNGISNDITPLKQAGRNTGKCIALDLLGFCDMEDNQINNDMSVATINIGEHQLRIYSDDRIYTKNNVRHIPVVFIFRFKNQKGIKKFNVMKISIDAFEC